MRRLELRIPPLLVLALFSLVALLSHTFLPRFTLPVPAANTLATGVLLLGAAAALLGVIQFRRAHTTVNPTAPSTTRSVVTGGIYAFTRNPMYLGFALGLLAVAIACCNLTGFVLVPLFCGYLTRFQIIPEERVLLERFGEDYARYMARVRRWV
jgi:protein-S-isoprenylcysteine O-methyltransferase Ste14